jgi:hypothetical protein
LFDSVLIQIEISILRFDVTMTNAFWGEDRSMWSKLVLVMIALGTLAGCAHQRLVDSAQDHLHQGRYELALREYDQALRQKPDHAKSQMGYRAAKHHLDAWLQNLQQAADHAYDNHQPGKALLLYGKLAQARGDSASLESYRELYSQLKQQYRLQVDLAFEAFDAELFDDSFRHVAGLEVLPGAADQYRFSLQNLNGNVAYTDETRQQDYLSGVEVIANPDFVHLQDDIEHLRSDVYNSRQTYRKHRKRHRRLERRLQRAQTELDNFEGNEAQLEQQRETLTELQHRLNNSEKKLNKYQRRCRRAERNLEHHYERLSYTAPTVERDLFSTYRYDVTLLSQILTADLVYLLNDVERSNQVAVEHTDFEHGHHPTIELPAKASVRLSDETLRDRLQAQAGARVTDILRGAVREHREAFLLAARSSDSPSDRFEYWVAYSLAGDGARNRNVEADLRRHLALEFGNSAEFSVNQLLDLYGDRLTSVER